MVYVSPNHKHVISKQQRSGYILLGVVKIMIEVGFEPTPPKRLVPKTSALDHSAIQPRYTFISIYILYVHAHGIKSWTKGLELNPWSFDVYNNVLMHKYKIVDNMF